MIDWEEHPKTKDWKNLPRACFRTSIWKGTGDVMNRLDKYLSVIAMNEVQCPFKIFSNTTFFNLNHLETVLYYL